MEFASCLSKKYWKRRVHGDPSHKKKNTHGHRQQQQAVVAR